VSVHPPLPLPTTDPTAIFDAFRGICATEILAVAVAHFDVFSLFAQGPIGLGTFAQQLEIAPRPATVFLTALSALSTVARQPDGRFALTPVAREHLVPGEPFYVGDYLAQAAEAPDVLALVERLRSNQPLGATDGDPDDEGTAFIYREGVRSAMDAAETARRLTLALAGRARNLGPVLAERFPLDGARVVLDAGGGTGIYSYALLRRNPQLRAVVWDRAEVLKVAAEMAAEYGVADRVQFVPGDMFADPVPAGCDVVLLSNVLHDWDVPECDALVRRLAATLPPGGRVLIHDVFLNDQLDGPLPVALYSVTLFTLTEGRAYSRAEYAGWLRAAGLTPADEVVPTMVHCGVLAGTKPG